MKKETKLNSFLKKNLTKLKRVGTIALAATVALSVPAVSNVVSEATPFEDLSVSVAHAQAENLMNVNETLTNFYVNYHEDYEHWVHAFHNDGDVPVDGPDFDVSELTYVVKFPDELSRLLDDEYVLDYLLGNITNFGTAQNSFMVTGFVIDENDERITINKDNHEPYKYISVNKETNSIEFDFNSFYSSNNLKPYFRQDVNGDYYLNNFGFQTPIVVPDSRILDNGTYEFKTAIVQGKSVDLDNVSNAYSENLVVDYSTDPEPEPEPEVDRSELESLVSEANAYNADEYTEESFEALLAALGAAETVLANEEASQEDVDAAADALQEAIDGLEAIEEAEPEPEVDTSELTALVEDAKAYDAEDYTEESFEALAAALGAAEAVLANEKASQEDVDAATALLQEAIDALEAVEGPTPNPDPEPTPDPEVEKNDLQALVDNVKGYDANDYTKESFAAFSEALAAAEDVLGNEEATQEEVDAALANLEAAIDDLVEAEQVVIIEDGEDEEEETGETVVVDEDGDRLPDTATNNYTFLLVGSLFVLFGGIALFARRKLV